MNDREVLKDWQRRRLNETLEEHDMRMDITSPWNVLAASNRKNERGDSAILPTSRRSSNGGHGNAAKANRRAEAAAQEAAGRAGVRAASTSPTPPPPQDGLPPREASIFTASIPLLPALDGGATRATAAPFLRERSPETGCDWVRVSLCLACGEGPSLVKCQM
jgi:hypothetical protein